MENDVKKVNWVGIFPLLLIVVIVPLVAHLKVIQGSDPFYKSFRLTQDFDFYSYYKMLLFLIFTAIAVGLVLVKFIAADFDLKKSYIYIYIIGFAVLSVFSYLLSPNRNIALLGYYGRYEGVITLVAYMFILFYTINTISTEDDVWFIFYALVFSSFIIGVIGISQFTGHDFLQTSFVKHLMISGVKGVNITQIATTIEKYMVYATLYHPDYVGSFMAIVVPLFLSLTVLLKKRKNKLIFGFMSLFMLINLIGSRSRAGIFGVLVSLMFFAVFYRKFLFRKWKYIVFLIIGLIVVLFIGNRVTGGALFKKLFTLNVDTRISINSEQIENISISSNTVSIFTQDDVLNITLNEDGVQFKDSNNKIIPTKMNNGKIVLDYYKYKDCSFQYGILDKTHVLAASVGNVKLAFGLTDKGVKFLDSRYQLVDIQPVESFGFSGHEQLGSSRGYIWSRSLPLLKNTLFVGYGPDTFAAHFPQDDFIGKIKAYGNIGMLVDKAHDLYLQTAINTGVLSLIALLGIFATYFSQSFKLYFKSDYSETYSVFGVSIFVGIVGYLAAAFFNDSVVSVAPIFWVLLGVGVSINLKLANMTGKTSRLYNK